MTKITYNKDILEMIKKISMFQKEILIVNKDDKVCLKQKNDYQIYLKECKINFDRMSKDKTFTDKLYLLYPEYDIQKSLYKAFMGYWSTEKGWKKKKGTGTVNIDWDATIINTLEFNLVKL